MSENKERSFRLEEAPGGGVLKVTVGNLVMSVTTIDGQNEVLVYAVNDPSIHVTHKSHVTDFNEIVRVMWNLERLLEQ
tara:strand:+ start:1608 stop:1841 length:234 start_codon:yes stop_codon:yes gene_type:complete